MAGDRDPDLPHLSEQEIQRIKALRFRSWRRGFREADLLMGGFFDAHGQELDATELMQFEKLLRIPDWEVYYALTPGQDLFDPAFGPLIKKMRAFAQTEMAQKWSLS